MKPQLLKVIKDQGGSFNVRRGSKPDVNNHWHFHPELEMVYFKKGEGTQFVGDNISKFTEGDLVLVGSNLPHYWKFDDVYFQASETPVVDVVVIHFNEKFLGDVFLNLPENKFLISILDKAKRGIQLSGLLDSGHESKINQLLNTEGTRKILLLLEILLTLGEPDAVPLASVGFQNNFQESEKDRINAIYNYTLSNYQKQISLKEIAEVAVMSPNSFCKFFKSRSGKTYSEFVNEIRIGQACRLLMESDYTVKEICFRCGFQNFSSFHKFFRLYKQKSPLEFRKTLQQA